jgi:hypothetical protein
MSTASLLAYARSQIGYTERPDNDTKYGRQFGMNRVPWCMMFVWCCHANSDNPGLVPHTASTREFFAKAKKGELGMKVQPASTTPRPGDTVLYDLGGIHKPVNHIGIVEKVLPGGGFIAIEGNASNRVARKDSNSPERKGRVVAFVRTRLAGAASRSGPPPFPGRNIKRGDSGPDVKRIQARLNHLAHGHHGVLGGQPLHVGGHFGPKTEAVVKVFQRHRGLQADGVVGPLTWKSLFG